MPGTLFVVATPIGNLEDVTARALRVLREVAIIAAEDTRRTSHLLARYAISTPTTSLHEHNEARKAGAILDRLKAGDNVALVSDAGTPTISDPGLHLVRQAIEAGVRVEAVPGPSAVMAALAASGLETETFAFMGFPPAKGRQRAEWFGRARGTGGTIVFFEAPHRLRRTLQDWLNQIGDCPAVACREMTKVHEELVRGPISELLKQLEHPRGEFVIVAEVGRTIEKSQGVGADDEAVLAEFGRMTEIGTLSRRRTISEVARRFGRSPNAVYRLIERRLKSG